VRRKGTRKAGFFLPEEKILGLTVVIYFCSSSNSMSGAPRACASHASAVVFPGLLGPHSKAFNDVHGFKAKASRTNFTVSFRLRLVTIFPTSMQSSVIHKELPKWYVLDIKK